MELLGSLLELIGVNFGNNLCLGSTLVKIGKKTNRLMERTLRALALRDESCNKGRMFIKTENVLSVPMLNQV